LRRERLADLALDASGFISSGSGAVSFAVFEFAAGFLATALVQEGVGVGNAAEQG
jgi:hypothetical protein